MILDLDALAVIDAIDRRGSFAAAADELHRVPSAVTYSVRKLEQTLGVALFDRRGHRAVLTEAGRALLQDGRQLLRGAGALEAKVKRIATGWEAELALAVDHMIPMAALEDLVRAFYATDCGTRLQLRREVFGGTWDALMSGRADLAVGASGEGPPGGGYVAKSLGAVEMVFAVAPDHPLARLADPISEADVLQHRAIAVADTSRHLPPRSAGVLTGQDVLTVPDLHTKRMLQRAGLGVGRLPRRMIAEDLAAGRLVEKRVEAAVPAVRLAVAWRSGDKGRALRWWAEQLLRSDVRRVLVDG